MSDYLIGVDLGGTKILTARCTPDGHVQAQARERTPAGEGVEAGFDCMAETVMKVLDGVDLAGLQGVGVGVPGPLDPATGILYGPPNLAGWDHVPVRGLLRERLQARLGRDVRVIAGNDANAAALGEFRFGAGRHYPGLREMVYITVSTGIGGGVISNGQIYVGAHGMAAEIGHMTVDMHGPRCKCGNIGCIEAIAAGPAIARQGAALVSAGQAPRLAQLAGNDPGQVTSEMVEAAAKAGDRDVRALIERTGHALGVAVVNALHLFNPQLVVIGGGVAKMGSMLFDPIIATVQAQAIPAIRRDVPIVPAALGDQVGVLGAAALVLSAG